MKQVGGVLALALALMIFVFALLPQTDPAVRAEHAAAAIERSQWITRLIIGLICIGLAVIGGAGMALVRYLYREAGLVRPRDGLYPATPARMQLSVPMNQPNAQVARALTYNMDRLGGGAGVTRQLLQPPEPEPLALPAPEELPAERVVDVDPVERPHWLIVGQTGSGKSTAARFILKQLARRYPCEFVVCEPGGVDWNSQAAAYTEQGIAGAVVAVYEELTRRQALLKAADCTHVTQLGAVPYLYLVVEEMEAVLDDLRDVDRRRAGDVRIRLRNIARLGRKAGIGLIAVTQAARLDVFDAHVRENMPNLLLFRGSQGTARVFGVDVDLQALPTGTAYSAAHGRTITFPQTVRPALPAWGGYRELPGDNAAVPVADWPQPVAQPVVDATTADFGAPEPATTGWQPVVKLEAGRAPTAEQAEWIRRNVKPNTRRGINWATDKLWGYGDDDVDAFVWAALRGEL